MEPQLGADEIGRMSDPVEPLLDIVAAQPGTAQSLQQQSAAAVGRRRRRPPASAELAPLDVGAQLIGLQRLHPSTGLQRLQLRSGGPRPRLRCLAHRAADYRRGWHRRLGTGRLCYVHPPGRRPRRPRRRRLSAVRLAV